MSDVVAAPAASYQLGDTPATGLISTYQSAISSTGDHLTVVGVFDHLLDASPYDHLPAFVHCS